MEKGKPSSLLLKKIVKGMLQILVGLVAKIVSVTGSKQIMFRYRGWPSGED